MPFPVAPAEPEKSVRVDGEGPQLIADLFHALNQPLTALQCSLELSLRRPRSEDHDRETLQSALRQAEQIARQISGIRELLQAEDPGQNPQVLSLEAFLRALVGDLEPVAEALATRMLLEGDSPCHVLFEPHRLQQALFHFLDVALCSGAPGGVLRLSLTEYDNEAMISLEKIHIQLEACALTEEETEKAPALSRRLALAIVRQIVEAAGGTLQIRLAADRLQAELRLPLSRHRHDCRALEATKLALG